MRKVWWYTPDSAAAAAVEIGTADVALVSEVVEIVFPQCFALAPRLLRLYSRPLCFSALQELS